MSRIDELVSHGLKFGREIYEAVKVKRWRKAIPGSEMLIKSFRIRKNLFCY